VAIELLLITGWQIILSVWLAGAMVSYTIPSLFIGEING
tara:strand:+ start:430 stop:546 length:117 start_codon:yes stop_codon:yes gene_type:complete